MEDSADLCDFCHVDVVDWCNAPVTVDGIIRFLCKWCLYGVKIEEVTT